MITIKDWPLDERPREKLLKKGPDALSDAELLAIFLGTGVSGKTAVDVARELLDEFGGLRGLCQADQRSFCQVKGMGPAKFVAVQAGLEMAKRHLASVMLDQPIFTAPDQVRDYLRLQLRDAEQEHFALLHLDAKHRVLGFEVLFKGTLDAASVYPREVVKAVLKSNAHAVILVHNHPSGDCEPSAADRQITRSLVESLKTIDVPVLDHFVVGDQVVSFAERGWM